MVTRKKIRDEHEDAELPELAKMAVQAHEDSEQFFRQGVHRAIDSGTYLLKAQRKCKHGTWLQWLKANCLSARFSQSSAYLYINIAELIEGMPEERDNIDDMSLREAKDYLDEQKAKKDKDAETIDDQTLHSFEKFSKSLMGMPDPRAWLIKYRDKLESLLPPFVRLTLNNDCVSDATDGFSIASEMSHARRRLQSSND